MLITQCRLNAMFRLRNTERLGATKQGYLWIAGRTLSVSERANSCGRKERCCADVIASKSNRGQVRAIESKR